MGIERADTGPRLLDTCLCMVSCASLTPVSWPPSPHPIPAPLISGCSWRHNMLCRGCICLSRWAHRAVRVEGRKERLGDPEALTAPGKRCRGWQEVEQKWSKGIWSPLSVPSTPASAEGYCLTSSPQTPFSVYSLLLPARPGVVDILVSQWGMEKGCP